MRLPWRRDGDLSRLSPHRAAMARAYRAVLHRPLRPVPEPPVAFAIPLVGRAQSPDWDGTLARLADTLASVDRQGYPRTEIVICGQDAPPGFPRAPGETFLPAPPYRAGRSGNDRVVKMRRIFRHLTAPGRGFAYVALLDADDIVHPRLAAHVAADNNGRGYLIDKGYIVGAGQVAPLDPATMPYAFWDFCGSCAVIAVEPGRQWLPAHYLSRFASRHHEFANAARMHGYPLEPVPFPAALYLFDHGSNASIRHGRFGGKHDYLSAHALPQGEARAVLADFGLSQASITMGDSRLPTIA